MKKGQEDSSQKLWTTNGHELDLGLSIRRRLPLPNLALKAMWVPCTVLPSFIKE